MRNSRTAYRRAVALAAATVMALSGMVVPGAPASAEQDEQVLQAPGTGGRQWTVTLVTGDTVRLTDEGGGRYSAVADPVRRPDGRMPVISIRSSPTEILAVPDDAQGAVDAGILERSLFDVKYLALNGYADDAAKQLPLIVQYGKAARRSAFATAEALPASDATIPLSSVDGAALRVDKQRAGQFWSAVRTAADGEQTGQVTALAGGIGRVWLDHAVTATLADSVPLIGAPAAWESGLDGTGTTVAVLDTGIDATHPDLAGKVAASRSFIPGEEVADGHGHGTHVAATLAGSGAASGGAGKGVAPGASLVIGKVLDNAGNGADSSVIAGMEWAAGELDADVVSMSLGAGPTDGTDPLSQAVDNLTASTGALFVVAAGNTGPDSSTVAAPGAAASALTVAATSKNDALADFSARGPRVGDGALKPDLAAPGVDIVAARAAGTTMGTPVDDRHTTASGTSMATPHVAGAAAILAQANPDWTWDQLKAALMSTSKDTGHGGYETGAGRVDVARAVSQKVVATTANLDFGISEEGQTAPMAKEVTYANSGETEVTLSLTAGLRAADGALSAPGSVTVPAGGTATVTVTLDPAGLGKGLYTGGVVATDEAGGIRISTPVGLNRSARKYALTVRTIGLDGGPAPRPPADGVRWEEMIPNVSAVDVPDVYWAEPPALVEPGVLRYQVEAGTHMVLHNLMSTNRDNQTDQVFLVNPEVVVAGDTEITLDARTTVPVEFNTPDPIANGVNVTRMVATDRSAWDQRYAGTHLIGVWSGRTLVTPTQRVTKGDFLFNPQITAHNQQLRMSVVSPRRFDLNPFQLAVADEGTTFPSDGMPVFAAGTQRRELAYVDTATRQDIAEVDLRGKIAVQRLDPTDTVEVGCWILDERMRWLKDAGAVGVLVYVDTPHPGCFEWMHDGEDYVVALPFARLTPAEGHRLTALLAQGPVRVQVTGNPEVDYTYQLNEYVTGRVPASMTYDYEARDLARVDARFHGEDRATSAESWHVWKDGESFSASIESSFVAPSARTEYFGGLAADVLWQGTADLGQGRAPHRWASFTRPTRDTWRWGATPISPGAETLPPIETVFWRTSCVNCRLGDVFAPLYQAVQSDGITDNFGGYLNLSSRLFRDGVEIPRTPPAGLPAEWPVFTLPKEKGTYTLTQTHDQISTKWTFRSATVTRHTAPGYGEYCPPGLFGTGEVVTPCAPQPLVYTRFDLGEVQGLDNKVATGRRTFDVTAYHAQSTARMPAIGGLKLWYSTDDGATWKSARVKRSRASGEFRVTVDLPALARTSGAVSLRVEAWDVEGNRIEQTMNRAFALR